MNNLFILILTIFSLTFSLSAVSENQPVFLKRIALVVGSNVGGEERMALKYAVRDASTFAKVLENLGGVSPENILMINNPDKKAFLAGLQQIKQMAENDEDGPGRKEVIIYYSGHADEKGILLGVERLGYPEFKERIDQIPVNVRIAVLDACASGSLTREKGGISRPAFLFDASSVMQGHAYLTSNSSDEAAQESENLKGSFFTYYLVSGLRGAADVNGDRKVTLNEAYQYAFQETLKKTEKTYSGPQHPAYDIRLKGSGDLVMTDLRTGSAGLRVPEMVTGRLFIRDSTGNFIAELNKVPGKQIEIGLEPGVYQVLLEKSDSAMSGKVYLENGKFTELSENSLEKVTAPVFTTRGSGLVVSGASTAKADAVPIKKPEKSISGTDISLFVGHASSVDGTMLSGGINMVDEDMKGVQAAVVGNMVDGNVKGDQIGGFLNMSGDLAGSQYSSSVNIVKGDLTQGYQTASTCNIVRGDGDGGQWGGFNFTGGTMYGIQLGMANFAGVTRGFQMALVNVSKEAFGVQLGLVNISNENDGAPVGLISIVKKRPPRVQVWGDDSRFLFAGIRTGSQHAYSILAVGSLAGDIAGRNAVVLGIGFHKIIGPTYAGLEILDVNSFHHFSVWGSASINTSKLRLISGWQFASHFSFWGGPSINYNWSDNAWGPGLVLGMEF